MGNDLRTHGARLVLRPGTDERELVEFVKELLTDPQTLIHSRIEKVAVEAAETLEQLFAVFDLIIVRDASNNVVSSFAYSFSRHYQQEALLEAIAPAVTDDSWIACSDDQGSMLATFAGGRLHVNRFDSPGWLTWSWGYQKPDDVSAGFDDPDLDFTELVRHITTLARTVGSLPELGNGYATPIAANSDVQARLISSGEPYRLLPVDLSEAIMN